MVTKQKGKKMEQQQKTTPKSEAGGKKVGRSLALQSMWYLLDTNWHTRIGKHSWVGIVIFSS